MQDFKGNELKVGDKVIFVAGEYLCGGHLAEGTVTDLYSQNELCYVTDKDNKVYGLLLPCDVAKVGVINNEKQ